MIVRKSEVKTKCPACFCDVSSPGRLYQEQLPVLRMVMLPDANVELFFYDSSNQRSVQGVPVMAASFFWGGGIKLLRYQGEKDPANIFAGVSSGSES